MCMVASTCFLFSSVFISIFGEGKTHLMFRSMCQLSPHRTLSRFDRGFDLPANGCDNTAMPRSMVTWLTWWRHKKHRKNGPKRQWFRVAEKYQGGVSWSGIWICFIRWLEKCFNMAWILYNSLIQLSNSEGSFLFCEWSALFRIWKKSCCLYTLTYAE